MKRDTEGAEEEYARSIDPDHVSASKARGRVRVRLKPKDRVGYKSPPAEHRFQPGVSGNPRGRPKGAQSFGSTLGKILNERITIRVGDKLRKVTRLEAMHLKNVSEALKGNMKAMQVVLGVARTSGLLERLPPDKLQIGDISSFTDEELEIFERLLEKADGKIVPGY